MFTSAFFGVYIEVQTFPEHSLFVSRPIWASGGSKHSQREKQENGKAKYWNSKPMQAEPIQYVCEGEKTHMYIISWPWLFFFFNFFIWTKANAAREQAKRKCHIILPFSLYYTKEREWMSAADRPQFNVWVFCCLTHRLFKPWPKRFLSISHKRKQFFFYFFN